MSFPVSVDLIKSRLVDRLDSLILQLYPNAAKEGHEWKLGSIQGEPGSSMCIHRSGHKAGWWKDFCGGDGGDILTLVAVAPATGCGGEVKAAIQWSLTYLGLGSMTVEERRRAEADAERTRREKERQEASDLASRQRAAKARWLEGKPLFSSIAYEYLRCRGLDVPPPATARDQRFRALRSHDRLLDPETKTHRPAMVAAIQRRAGGIISMHRTFLERLPSGLVVKARAMQKPKRAYCSYQGGFVSINRGATGKPIGEMPDGEWITVAEGTEDSVAISLAMPDERVVCAISLSNIGALDLPRHIGGIYIHRHRGDPPEAVRAFQGAVDRLMRRGLASRQIRELWAPDGFKDFTEVFEAARDQRLREGWVAASQHRSEASS